MFLFWNWKKLYSEQLVAFYMPHVTSTSFLKDIHKDMVDVPNIPGC